MSVPTPPIITCPQWGAMPPRRKPTLTGRPVRSIFHHTAGHAPATGAGRLHDHDAAVAYAHALQRYHMDVNGWNDSGHNFLVMRSGVIVQGRWGSVTAIEHGRMVVSAHCPGQNDQPGIEHEHLAGDLLTPAQLDATVLLHAWIFDRCKVRPTEIFGHRIYYPTACPSTLADEIPHVRALVAQLLTRHGRGGPRSPLALLPARIAGGRTALV